MAATSPSKAFRGSARTSVSRQQASPSPRSTPFYKAVRPFTLIPQPFSRVLHCLPRIVLTPTPQLVSLIPGPLPGLHFFFLPAFRLYLRADGSWDKGRFTMFLRSADTPLGLVPTYPLLSLINGWRSLAKSAPHVDRRLLVGAATLLPGMSVRCRTPPHACVRFFERVGYLLIPLVDDELGVLSTVSAEVRALAAIPGALMHRCKPPTQPQPRTPQPSTPIPTPRRHSWRPPHKSQAVFSISRTTNLHSTPTHFFTPHLTSATTQRPHFQTGSASLIPTSSKVSASTIFVGAPPVTSLAGERSCNHFHFFSPHT